MNFILKLHIYIVSTLIHMHCVILFSTSMFVCSVYKYKMSVIDV